MPDSSVRMADGTFDFSGGVDSGRTTTVQSQMNPNGLPRTMLAWLDNGTVRGGGIQPRFGFQPLLKLLAGGLFQGGYLYTPDFANPYLILMVSGRVYKVLVEAPFTVTDLSAEFHLTNPATVPQAFFAQGEEFLIIQAGDIFTNAKPTLPLFWDGTILRRSNGITGNLSGPQINELPAAGPMVYYQGRLWYGQGRTVSAGDIVGGPSGTAQYDLRDAILKVTENPLALGGDGFTVPSTAGNITALSYTSNLDTSLGQGPLYIFTRNQVYSLVVPVTRTAWIAADASNQPTMTVAQIKFGAVSDRCVVHVNGDLFYQTLLPGINSLFVATRYFQQWGNVPISRNENRALAFNNRALMPFSNGINFDNRLLQAILPTQTPNGVVFQGIAALDFDIIGSFGAEGINSIGEASPRPPPAWEGMLEGIDIFQLFEGDFGGLDRAFAVIRSRLDQSIQIWEVTGSSQTDNGDSRINWYFETPAFTWEKEFDMKKLDGGELWIDSISGTVQMTVQYRPDADPCWQDWAEFQFCAARNQCEDANDPLCSQYPQPTFCEGYKFPVTLPTPPAASCASMNKRPVDIGFQFQVRVQVKGWCRVRGLLLYALPVLRRPFEDLVC